MKRYLIIILILFCLILVGYLTSLKRTSTELKPNAYPVVILGDSLGAGAGASSADKTFASRLLAQIKLGYSEAQLHNLAVSGVTTPEVVASQLPQLKGSNISPRLIVIVVGTNDILYGATDEQFRANYQQLIDGVREYQAAILVLNISKFTNNPLFPNAAADGTDRKIQHFNSIIADTTQPNTNIQLFDFYSFSKDLVLNEKVISVDGFHPNDAGYEKLANAVGEFLKLQ